jgi:hypothetical protein
MLEVSYCPILANFTIGRQISVRQAPWPRMIVPEMTFAFAVGSISDV